MAFLNINAKKLNVLISNGTHEGELRRFFQESKQLLLLRGAKVQNLPHGREERIRVICERLPRKTDEVLRNWFTTNASIATPTPMEEVLMYLEALFDENEPLPAAEELAICRSALSNLFSDNPDERLIELLARPLGPRVVEEVAARDHEVSADVDEQDFESVSKEHDSVGPIQNFHLAELIAAIVASDENAIDDALAPFSESTRGLVNALVRLRAGDNDSAREQLSLLPSSGPESDLVRRALAQASHHQADGASPRGIRALTPPALPRIPEGAQFEIVGIYTTELGNGAIFVDPVLIILEGNPYYLGREDRLHMFPESGSVMSHRSALRSAFKRGALVRWIVSERDGAEGKTRFHMSSEQNAPISVVKLSVPSSDADEVRDRIKSCSIHGRAQAGQQVVFLLSDNVAIASPKGISYARDDAFEQPWQAWSSLETHLIEGEQYCLSLPTGPSSNLDLSPLEIAFRRLLRDIESETKLTSTKAQRREISELLRKRAGGEISHRAKRIASSIEQISMNSDELDAVLSLLGSQNAVRDRVEELVAEELKARQSDRAGLMAEISALRSKISELDKAARDKERSNRQQAESAAEQVKEAFDRAIREGAVALANAEVFQTLSSTYRAPSLSSDTPAEKAPSGLFVRHTAISTEDAISRMLALGVNRRKAIILSSLAVMAASCGIALALVGTLARQCARILARQDRDNAAFMEVSMGLTSSDLVHSEASELAGAGGLAILNSDLSPIEIYAASLIDSLIDDATSGTKRSPVVVLSCGGGDLSLSIPSILRRVSLVVDLESDWPTDLRRLEDVDPSDIELLEPLQERAMKSIKDLDEDLRRQVESAFVAAITRNG